jgi:hypothetical protein
MISGKLEPLLSMHHLEHRNFLLCDELGSLNSIIKLSSSDLAHNTLFVACREPGWAASRMVFFVLLHFLANSSNSTLFQICSSLYLMMRIPFIEKRNNRIMLGSRNRSHGDGEKEERRLNQVQHVKCVQTKSGNIVYYF